jgi:hypothetical protein
VYSLFVFIVGLERNVSPFTAELEVVCCAVMQARNVF